MSNLDLHRYKLWAELYYINFNTQELIVMVHTYNITQIVGASILRSDNAITAISVNLNNIECYEVIEHREHIENGDITHFQLIIRIGS